jgi:hypothetical protein
MSQSDLVIVPIQASELDAVEAVKIIQFIAVQEKAFRRPIPCAVILTKTNHAVRPRTLTSLAQDMLEQGIPLFATELNERDAFRAIFTFGGSLSGLRSKAVGGLPAALNNAKKFTAETIDIVEAPAATRCQQPYGGGLMTSSRPTPFSDKIDISGFAPKTGPDNAPTPCFSQIAKGSAESPFENHGAHGAVEREGRQGRPRTLPCDRRGGAETLPARLIAP